MCLLRGTSATYTTTMNKANASEVRNPLQDQGLRHPSHPPPGFLWRVLSRVLAHPLQPPALSDVR